jgi:diguanylate cyclase (GGDEF)-like protein
MFVSFDILNKESLKKYNLLHDSLFSLYFGAVLALILYNFFIYLLNREKVYFFYILYALSFLIWQLTSNGFYPFNTFNTIFNFYALGSIVPLWIAMLIFFSRSILETKKLLPKSDKFLFSISLLYLFLTFSSIFFLQKSFVIINILATFILPFLLYIGYKSYKLGNKSAIFFVIAQTTFLSMSTLFSLMSDGIVEYSLLTRYGIVVASFIEMILFAFALGYKIKQLQDEKLEIIYKHSLELDKKVKERTKELEKTQEELKRLANKDPLTDLYNRRSLIEIATKLIELAKREHNNLATIMFDIDKFKNVNDTYGHAVGDIVIKEFANILKETRESDIVARIGGEEFLLLLPNTDQKDALQIANTIRIKCENMKISIEDDKFVSFTVSGGVDMLILNTNDTLNATMQRVDIALYEAKKNGRNQICTTISKTE